MIFSDRLSCVGIKFIICLNLLVFFRVFRG
jgi:hypothetical protein